VEFGSGCAEYGKIGFPGSEDEETSHGEPTHTSEDAPLGGVCGGKRGSMWVNVYQKRWTRVWE